MSTNTWAEIARLMGAHEYMDGVSRTVERIRATAEVFTPSGLVVEIVQNLPTDALGPGKQVLDPACGDGQFLVAVKWVKVLHHGMSEEKALADIYGIDIMRDNVDMCLRRLGGGTILMGDALHPSRRLVGQTDAENAALRGLFSSAIDFGEPPNRPGFKRPPKGVRDATLWTEQLHNAGCAA